jgi:hypothetical protein
MYAMIPGTVFHELGHYLGCRLTGTEVTGVDWFVVPDSPFAQLPLTAGVVRYVSPSGRLASLKRFVIAVGPVVTTGVGVVGVVMAIERVSGLWELPLYFLLYNFLTASILSPTDVESVFRAIERIPSRLHPVGRVVAAVVAFVLSTGLGFLGALLLVIIYMFGYQPRPIVGFVVGAVVFATGSHVYSVIFSDRSLIPSLARYYPTEDAQRVLNTAEAAKDGDFDHETVEILIEGIDSVRSDVRRAALQGLLSIFTDDTSLDELRRSTAGERTGVSSVVVERIRDQLAAEDDPYLRLRLYRLLLTVCRTSPEHLTESRDVFLDGLNSEPPDERRVILAALYRLAENHPDRLAPAVPALTAFATTHPDDETDCAIALDAIRQIASADPTVLEPFESEYIQHLDAEAPERLVAALQIVDVGWLECAKDDVENLRDHESERVQEAANRAHRTLTFADQLEEQLSD